MATILDAHGHPLAQSLVNPVQQMDLAPPLNNNWLVWAQRYVEGITNPDQIPVEVYERMVASDETVASGTEILIQQILGMLDEYTHEDPDIEAFVRLNFEKMDGNFIHAVREILSAVIYGHSSTEIIWRIGQDKRIWLRGLQTLHPRSLNFDLHQEGPDKNKLRWVKQWWRQGQDEVEIHPSKVIVYSHNTLFGNIYGRSRLRPAYKSWLIKDVLLKAWSITLERFGCPLAVGKVPNPEAPITVNGSQMTTAEYVSRVLDSLSTNGSLVVPSTAEIQILTSEGGQQGQGFHQAVTYQNRSIHQAIGLPSLIADAGTVGSQSLGVEHARTLKNLLWQILVEVTEVLLEQLVRRMIEANFGPQESYGEFLVNDYDPTLAAHYADIAEKLCRTGVASVDKLDDVNHFREQQGLALWTQEDLDAAYPPVEDPIADADADDQVEPEDAPDLPDPDRHSSSLSGRRRKLLRRKLELYRRISREARAS